MALIEHRAEPAAISRRARSALAGVIAAVAASGASAASGESAAASARAANCAIAESAIERAICESVYLRDADAWMAQEYGALRETLGADDRRALLAEQRAWLRGRGEGCAADAATFGTCLLFDVRRRAAAMRARRLGLPYPLPLPPPPSEADAPFNAITLRRYERTPETEIRISAHGRPTPDPDPCSVYLDTPEAFEPARPIVVLDRFVGGRIPSTRYRFVTNEELANQKDARRREKDAMEKAFQHRAESSHPVALSIRKKSDEKFLSDALMQCPKLLTQSDNLSKILEHRNGLHSSISSTKFYIGENQTLWKINSASLGKIAQADLTS